MIKKAIRKEVEKEIERQNRDPTKFRDRIQKLSEHVIEIKTTNTSKSNNNTFFIYDENFQGCLDSLSNDVEITKERILDKPNRQERRHTAKNWDTSRWKRKDYKKGYF